MDFKKINMQGDVTGVNEMTHLGWCLMAGGGLGLAAEPKSVLVSAML
jgi:hypothetical protein